MATLLAGCLTSLPSTADWRGGCGIGTARDATLTGSASDPRITWAIDRATGARLELMWPVGYSARFNPHLEVLDERRAVAAREGDLIIGACVMRPEDAGAMRVDATEVRPPTWQPGDG